MYCAGNKNVIIKRCARFARVLLRGDFMKVYLKINMYLCTCRKYSYAGLFILLNMPADSAGV